jgi:uncharacterized protein YndB with AHSA1/START domain
MRKIVLTQTVATSPEDVFVFFVPQRMPHWYGPEMRMSFETHGCGADFRVGSEVRISGTIANRQFSHTAVVSALDRGRVFEWQFEDAYGVRGKERWELEPLETAAGVRTVIHFTNEYETPGRLGRALDWLLTRHALERRDRDYLNRLAHLAERRPLAQSAANR